jgi:hypothetical protein
VDALLTHSRLALDADGAAAVLVTDIARVIRNDARA